MEKTGKRFVGKVAIVTASTQGIGFSIAERLGLEGAAVVVSSRKQKNVDEAVEKLKTRGIEVLGVVCHVSNSQQRKNLINKTIEKYGKIDVVVSNAAANPSVDAILETKESVLDKLWDINVKAGILLLQDAAPHLQKDSSVVLISSIAGFQPPKSMAMYGVTKTALLGLTKVSIWFPSFIYTSSIFLRNFTYRGGWGNTLSTLVSLLFTITPLIFGFSNIPYLVVLRVIYF